MTSFCIGAEMGARAISSLRQKSRRLPMSLFQSAAAVKLVLVSETFCASAIAAVMSAAWPLTQLLSFQIMHANALRVPKKCSFAIEFVHATPLYSSATLPQHTLCSKQTRKATRIHLLFASPTFSPCLYLCAPHYMGTGTLPCLHFVF